MQATKDTFYMTLCERLETVNPQRTATIAGVLRPALLAIENERAGVEDQVNECFCLKWGAAAPVQKDAPLYAVECVVSYRTIGTQERAFADLGRRLGAMDADLAAICEPRRARKFDYTCTPATELDSDVFWSSPVYADAEMDGAALKRNAKLNVYFFPEAA